MKSVLIIGGCGYIGSHMVKALLEAGHHVTIQHYDGVIYFASLIQVG